MGLQAWLGFTKLGRAQKSLQFMGTWMRMRTRPQGSCPTSVLKFVNPRWCWYPFDWRHLGCTFGTAVFAFFCLCFCSCSCCSAAAAAAPVELGLALAKHQQTYDKKQHKMRVHGRVFAGGGILPPRKGFSYGHMRMGRPSKLLYHSLWGYQAFHEKRTTYSIYGWKSQSRHG